MADNKTIVQKADLALSDLASQGKLSVDQTNRFIRKLIDTPTLLNSVRTVKMTTPDMRINKIGFGSRILMPATASTALDANTSATNRRSKADLSKVDLATKEVIAEINLPYEVVEDNIERGKVDGALQEGAGGLHNTIVDLIAERAALDLEELAINGDTASGADAYLKLMDGFLKLISSHSVAVGGAFSKDAIKQALKTLPTKFLRNKKTMRHFVNTSAETDLRDTFANRQTGTGDANLQSELPLKVFGTGVDGVALMPTANGIFTDPMNLIFGIQRDVTIEYDKDIRARVFVIVLTARVAFQIEEEDATVKYTGITV